MGFTPIKPIDNFNTSWCAILKEIDEVKSGTRESLKIVVVGGGVGGVEVCLSIQQRCMNIKGVSMVLVTRGKQIAKGCSPRIRSFFTKTLQDRGIELKFGKGALGIKRNEDGTRVLLLEDGIEVHYNELVWCTNSSSPEWLKKTNLSLTSDGFIEVDDYIQSINTPGVFACGDCSVMRNHLRPSAGVFAVRQGPPLLKNIRRMLKGKPLVGYHPQKRFLGLISTGDKYAVASRAYMPAMRGKWVWHWKDHIDRKFMKKFQDFPSMQNTKKVPFSAVTAGPEAVEVFEHASMRCGGCGSKIGADILRRVLPRLGFLNESIEDAGIVPIPAGDGIFVVQSVDYFRTCLQDPFLLGRIATVHCLSDIYAMGATPVSACVNAVIPYAGEMQVQIMSFFNFRSSIRVRVNPQQQHVLLLQVAPPFATLTTSYLTSVNDDIHHLDCD